MREYWGTFKSDTRLFMELSFSVSLSGLGQLNFFILKVSVIIKQVSETKFLGITIDNKLSWDTHINKLSKKLSCATGILNRISKTKL